MAVDMKHNTGYHQALHGYGSIEGRHLHATLAVAEETARLAEAHERQAEAQELANLLHAFDSLEFEEGRPTYLAEAITKELTERFGTSPDTITEPVSGRYLASLIAKRLVL